MHHVVLFEELCKHLCGAKGVDVWRDKEDDGGGGSEGGAAVCREDGSVGLAIGRTRGRREMGRGQEDHDQGALFAHVDAYNVDHVVICWC